MPQTSLEGWLKQAAGPIPKVKDLASLGWGQQSFTFLTCSETLAKAKGWEPHSENTDQNQRQGKIILNKRRKGGKLRTDETAEVFVGGT